MRELHALRRAGRARRVDDREDVVGADRAPVGLEAVDRVLLDLVDGDHVLDERFHDRRERRLHDRDLRARVTDHVRHLIRRRGEVDRERRRAEHRGREVRDHELRAVGDHQRDGVAARDPELGQPAGEGVHPRLQLGPRPGDLVVLRADRDAIRVVLDREPEGLSDRGGIY
jgi:hypothetical protein